MANKPKVASKVKAEKPSYTCNRCGKEKPEDKFFLAKWSKIWNMTNKRAPVCKECINAKNADAMYSAGSDMTVGMGVVKGANFEADFLASATATDIFFVTKEFIPTGLDSLKGEISDYNLENVKDGEKIVLVKPVIGEIYWTDQIDTGIAVHFIHMVIQCHRV